MKKTRKALSLEDRQIIWMMRAARVGIRETGRRLRKDPSIISRELRRNRISMTVAAQLKPLEQAKEAHAKAKERHRSKNDEAGVKQFHTSRFMSI